MALCLGGCEEEIAADIRKCLMTNRCDKEVTNHFLDIEILEASHAHTKSVSKGESGCGKLRIQSNIEIEQVIMMEFMRLHRFYNSSLFVIYLDNEGAICTILAFQRVSLR